MAMECKYGQMERSMKVFGRMEKQQEKESLYMSMEIFIRESGNKIKLVDMVFTSTTMVHATKDIGSMTINMVREPKPGLMVAHTLETTEKAKNMAEANTYGKMVATMMVTGLKIK